MIDRKADPTISVCLNCPDDDCKGTCSRITGARKEYQKNYYQQHKEVRRYRQKTNWEKWASQPKNIERRKKYHADRAAKKKLERALERELEKKLAIELENK
jgi:hypothetical protein